MAEIDGLNTPNPYGERPLIDNDPIRPNARYFEHVDYIIDQAGKLGIYIALLPKILGVPGQLKTKRAASKKTGDESPIADESEILLAITVALHLDQTRGGQNQKITWQRHETSDSAWRTAGRIRGLAIRGHHSVRN